MKAYELRIGNIITFSDPNCNIEVINIVKGIMDRKHEDSELVLLESSHVHIDSVRGVRLLESDLIDYGFVKEINRHGHTFKLSNFHLYKGNGWKYYNFGVYDGCNDDDVNTFNLEIKYIHQLQNLYYIFSGKDLVKTK